jgi:hypothetical protein
MHTGALLITLRCARVSILGAEAAAIFSYAAILKTPLFHQAIPRVFRSLFKRAPCFGGEKVLTDL